MLVVVNPAERGSREVSHPMADRAWREAHTTGAAAQTEDGVSPADAVPDVEFDIVYVHSAAEAGRAIQNALLQLR
jgi:D-alanyl-D-alanine dipeptidase